MSYTPIIVQSSRINYDFNGSEISHFDKYSGAKDFYAMKQNHLKNLQYLQRIPQHRQLSLYSIFGPIKRY
jgi:hypothetical protein